MASLLTWAALRVCAHVSVQCRLEANYAHQQELEYARTRTQFTQCSMNSTTTTTQIITEVEQRKVYGAEVKTWSGSNITASASAGIAGGDAVFTVTDTTLPWTLETTTRAAGLVEQWDTTRNYTINSTTTSLSVFSQ